MNRILAGLFVLLSPVLRGSATRKILASLFVVAISFAATFWAMGKLSPSVGGAGSRPALVELPPLKPATRPSVIVAPTAVALSTIGAALEATAPRNFSGKNENPTSAIFSKMDMATTAARGPISVGAQADRLTISTAINGTVHATGQLGAQAVNVAQAVGGLLGGPVAQQVQNVAGKPFDQTVDMRGNIVVTARPAITSEWRLDPNLAAQVTIAETAMSIAGVKVNVAEQAKPLVDNVVNQQVSALQARLQADPFIEVAARREWDKMCRSIPLGGAGSGLPDLWLELRPTRAFTAPPRIEAKQIILTVGVQAETRILIGETKPSCPFPSRLEIVPQVEHGRIAIGLPIDVPFTDVSRLLDAQLKGRMFPEDGSAPVVVVVQSASVAASGDRLLISLRVKAQENKSWFGFGAQADIHVWGRPVLDRDKQTLRMTDVALAVESEAAFGLLGAAARRAMPHLQNALAEHAVVDLKPFATNAREKIGVALADFRRSSEDIRIDAAITDLRLDGIEFDSKTLRVIAEAGGTVAATVTKLPGM
jgi:hypothetical protein